MTQLEYDVSNNARRTPASIREFHEFDRLEFTAARQAEVAERRNWTAAELASEDHSFRWLIKGLLPEASQSVTGGEKKTLKSYIDTFINLGIAAGVPIFGQFEVPKARPVKVYVGEGGRAPYARRLERIASAMGVRLDSSLPLHVQFKTAKIESTEFRGWLRKDLEELQPGRLSLDPLYPFHDRIEAGNMYDRGGMLNSYSEPCTLTGVSPNIVDHFKKSGSGRGLERLAQAGMGEWADSWLLLTHRKKPNVTDGEFHLLLEVGSRQWGGREWDLDLTIGSFDEERGEHIGEIAWRVEPHIDGNDEPMKGDSSAAKRILQTLRDNPFVWTQTQVRESVGGNRDNFDRSWDRLVSDDEVVVRKMERKEGGRTVTRELCGIVAE